MLFYDIALQVSWIPHTVPGWICCKRSTNTWLSQASAVFRTRLICMFTIGTCKRVLRMQIFLKKMYGQILIHVR
jgi:hypothetical protein